VARETTNAGKLGWLQKLADTLKANIPELPHLEATCLRFVSLVGEAQDASTQQLALAAEKQEMSKKFLLALGEGERLGNLLLLALKQHYGIRSEKLTEFGLQPFRGRVRKAKPVVESKKPAADEATATPD